MEETIKRKRRRRDKGSGETLWPHLGTYKYVILVLLCIILVGSNLSAYNNLLKTREVVAQQKQALRELQEPPDAGSEIDGKWRGLCEKNVVHSVADLVTLVQSDPLLSEHYANFDWDRARIGSLERSVWAHVTYRKAEKITTTRRVIKLPKGDTYITDGRRWLRTNCCNEYIVVPTPLDTAANPANQLDKIVK